MGNNLDVIKRRKAILEQMRKDAESINKEADTKKPIEEHEDYSDEGVYINEFGEIIRHQNRGAQK